MAGKDKDLESVGALHHERTKPVHSRRVTLNKLVVEHDGASDSFRVTCGRATVAEEMPEAYKDVADVVGVVHDAGISTRVAQLRPIGVIKG